MGISDVSARKFMVVIFSSTYCLSIIASIVLAVIGKIDVAVFLALLTGFSGTTLMIVEWYFKREDRKDKSNV